MSQPAGPVSSSTPASSLLPDSTGMFTAAHLVWIGLFALVAVLVIVWGMRQKASRKAAEREVAEHNADLAAAPPPPAMDPTASAEERVAPAVAGAVARDAAADGPVTQLKGLGPKVAQRLAELGVTTVGQIAALSDDDAAALDARLGAFSGRMARDRWQEQARFLAAGDRAGFEAVFGKL